MNRILLVFSTLISFVIAQNNSGAVLFTVDNKPVTVKEFERVYTKNNINNQADYSKASLQEYLNLYINFKLKVMEAERLQLDTIQSIHNELLTYQNQLVKTYSSNKEVTEELVQEAYDRSLKEIEASHILIAFKNPYPTAKDSAELLKVIKDIKSKTTTANFNDIALKYSQDPSAKDNKGYLGYLTVFQTVYPFENAMYKTPKGQISEPFPTQFGYHLVYVKNIRDARGAMTAAHILVKGKETDSVEKQAEAKETAWMVYQDIKNGAISFEAAANKYSADSKTKSNGGKLPTFTASEMLPSFADAAYALTQDGAISEPVKTPLGWHIIKRISVEEIPSFEMSKTDISSKVSRDSRSNVAQEKNIIDAKNQFGYSGNKMALDQVLDGIAKGFKDKTFSIEQSIYTQNLFTIGNSPYSQQDFIAYAQKNLKNADSPEELRYKSAQLYHKFENTKIQEYKEMHLAEVNEDFKNLMQEYHDGILLFDLTDKEVWSKAVEDTIGLKEYFDKHRSKYQWDDRVVYKTYTFKNEATALTGIKLLQKGKNSETVLSKLNKSEKLALVKETKTEIKDFDVADLKPQVGSNSTQKLDDGSTQYLIVTEIVPPANKELNETRGYVISDYQNYLEQGWIQNLKKRYPVVVNEQVFNSLIKK